MEIVVALIAGGSLVVCNIIVLVTLHREYKDRT